MHDYVYFVRPGDTLSGIVRDVLGPFPSHRAWMDAVEETAARSYIQDPDRILPGQVVSLSPAGACRPALAKGDLQGIEREWRSMSPQQRQAIEENWDILDWLGHGNTALGSAAASLENLSIERIKNLRPPPPKMTLELRTVLSRTRTTVVRVRSDAISVLRRDRIRLHTRRVIRLSVDRKAMTSYRRSLAKLGSTAKIAKKAGRGGMGLSVLLSGIDVYDDWDTSERYRTLSRESGSLLVGAAVGSAALYGVCNVVLGLPTAGTSLFWCGLVVTATGGVLGATAGGHVGEGLYDFAVEESYRADRLR